MNEMTLSSRHRFRNLRLGGPRPSTLHIGHGRSHNIESLRVSGEEACCFFENLRPEWGSNPWSSTFQAENFNICKSWCNSFRLQAANCCRNSRVVVNEDDLMWCRNCHLLINQFYGHFRSEALSCRKIKSVFRDVKRCFNASWGLKGLNIHFILNNSDYAAYKTNWKRLESCLALKGF